MKLLREFRMSNRDGLFFVLIDDVEGPPFSTLILAHEFINQEMTVAERAERADRWYRRVCYETMKARPHGVTKRRAIDWVRWQRTLIKMWFWRGIKRADVGATLVAMMTNELSTGCAKKAA